MRRNYFLVRTDHKLPIWTQNYKNGPLTTNLDQKLPNGPFTRWHTPVGHIFIPQRFLRQIFPYILLFWIIFVLLISQIWISKLSADSKSQKYLISNLKCLSPWQPLWTVGQKYFLQITNFSRNTFLKSCIHEWSLKDTDLVSGPPCSNETFLWSESFAKEG